MDASLSAAAVPAQPLAAVGVCVHAGARRLVEQLDLAFPRGEFTAILGRNGSGKTLTLHTLAGLRKPQEGAVEYGTISLDAMSRRDVARNIGLLMQDLEESFVTTALEAVLIGRHPHLKTWQWESADDERIARDALTRVNMQDFAARTTDGLSGGERRRVAIASLFAQSPDVFLLD